MPWLNFFLELLGSQNEEELIPKKIGKAGMGKTLDYETNQRG